MVSLEKIDEIETDEKPQTPDEMISSLRAEVEADYVEKEKNPSITERMEKLRQEGAERRSQDEAEMVDIRDVISELREDYEENFKHFPKVEGRTGVLEETDEETTAFIKEVLERIAQEEVPTCFVAFDFDGFKPINDHFGSEIGDACIDSFAQSLKERLRSTDITMESLTSVMKDIEDSGEGYSYRKGGDDYSALLPGASLEDVPAIVEKVSEIWTEKLRYVEYVLASDQFERKLADIEGDETELMLLEQVIKLNIGPTWTLERVLASREHLDKNNIKLNPGDISDKLLFSAGATKVQPGETNFSRLKLRGENALSKAKGKDLKGFQKIFKTLNASFTGKEEYSNRLVIDHVKEELDMNGEVRLDANGEPILVSESEVSDIRVGMKSPPRTSLF